MKASSPYCNVCTVLNYIIEIVVYRYSDPQLQVCKIDLYKVQFAYIEIHVAKLMFISF